MSEGWVEYFQMGGGGGRGADRTNMKKAPTRFVLVKSRVVKGPAGSWPMRPRPRQRNPIATTTAGTKAHLNDYKKAVTLK
jgi:hypothetical protein